MSFDWPKFLDTQRIHFVRRGRNIGFEEIGVKCPFCGSNDPSEHMAISLKGAGWSCRRNREEHSGKSPTKLVAALLGITFAEAKRIVGGDPDEQADPDDFDAKAGTWDEKREWRDDTPKIPHPEFPISMRLLNEPTGLRRLFRPYLLSRGYEAREVGDICNLYRLRGTATGPFRYRVIFPIEMMDGLASWTGRAIANGMEPRYKSLSVDAEKARLEGMPRARLVVSDCLWNAREIANAQGELLLGCEGPFDALRVDYFGRQYGIRATCFFGKNVSEKQAHLFKTIGRFRTRALLLDPDAIDDAIKTMFRSSLDFRQIPAGIKDPALLTRAHVKQLL